MSEKTPRLEVYLTQSVLFNCDKDPECFDEGNPSADAKLRLKRIKDGLEGGYLKKIIEASQSPTAGVDSLDLRHAELLSKLVDSVTSEVGRALVGLTVLQLCVKALVPEQSVRLHKAGGGGSNFSWAEGVPMRVLDKNHITPILRHFNLLKLNADGFMMTRSLAENYPYSKLYKAAIRGARTEWIELVDLIETSEIKPDEALRHLIGLLLNRSDKFKELANEAIQAVKGSLRKLRTLEDALRFIRTYVDSSPYSARVFEISMHALFQVLATHKVFGGVLKPLCQMRSANKKHGNIGDIEVITKTGGLEILEAWDAKYGKPYLRDELDEVNEKLEDHSETEIVGFVVDSEPNLKDEIQTRVTEIEQLHGVKIYIQSFDVWIKSQASRATGITPSNFAKKWVLAFSESLCQRRRKVAPIDEPSDAWVAALADHAKRWS
ncbi:MAG TPA: hypothetical protein VH595_22100 [Verrucomicrobiae bacterium]|jgi:hypothetical protein|nr:hypothetical protein [Verrucomicrobiae bacterium]